MCYYLSVLKLRTRDLQVENLPEKSVIFGGTVPHFCIKVMGLTTLRIECLWEIMFNKVKYIEPKRKTKFIRSIDLSIYNF